MAQLTEVSAVQALADTAIVTVAETVAVTSDAVYLPGKSSRVIVVARALVTLGASTTAVTPRVRRGTLITDTLVGEANAEQIKTAAGSTEPFDALAIEDVVDLDQVTYVLTVQQTAASANGSILSASILVLVL